MNLAEALVAALPELPVKTIGKRKLKLEPSLIVRAEEDENGQAIAVIFVPERAEVYRLPKLHWDLLQYFNGERDYAQVAAAFLADNGTQLEEAQIKEFAESTLETGLWYHSAQEKNITLSQKLADERHRRVKKKTKYGDMSHIIFKAWDPDKFLTWTHQKLGFVYSTWFTLLTLGLFAVMTVIFIDRWSEIGRDTLRYYNFTQKGFNDIVEFWVLFLLIAFFHESAHGLTCKHYGGEVHNMGFQLIYLTPAFAVEITEVWVRTGRWQRVIAIIAGIWIEMIFCGIATIIWWGTVPGTAVHEWSYKVMLITGVVVVVVNFNPLIKLDGYYALAEIIRIPDLKEKSTAFLSGWVKKTIFRLPVEVDYVPPRRRLFYVPYAILSGLYSYLLLFAVSRFAYNIFRHWTSDWAFVPAGLLALVIFKGRLRTLVRFMKTVYLDKRERLRAHMTPARWALASGFLLVLLFAPVWRKSVEARFLLEPYQRSVVRAQVPGFVEEVFASENQFIRAGSPVVRMRNLSLESEAARTRSNVQLASAKSTRAQLDYADLGSARVELRRAQSDARIAQDELSDLQPLAPISGIVITPRLRDIKSAYLAEGTEIAEIADVSSMRARLFLPEFEVRDVRVGAPASLRLPGSLRSVYGRVESVAPAPVEIAEGLMVKPDYKGLKPPNFYVVNVVVANPGMLKTGMSGDAKVFVRRRSAADLFWQTCLEFAKRKIW